MGKKRLRVTLITGRTIEQGVGKEQGKFSREYGDSVAVCFIDPEDLKRLDIKGKANVRISTDHGSVMVKAMKSLRGPHAGVIFIPYGLWANTIVETETDGIGMPSLKGIPAEIEAAQDESILDMNELLKKQFGK